MPASVSPSIGCRKSAGRRRRRRLPTVECTVAVGTSSAGKRSANSMRTTGYLPRSDLENVPNPDCWRISLRAVRSELMHSAMTTTTKSVSTPRTRDDRHMISGGSRKPMLPAIARHGSAASSASRLWPFGNEWPRLCLQPNELLTPCIWGPDDARMRCRGRVRSRKRHSTQRR